MPKLISIAIPAYNNCELLDRALESILKQTYRPIEVVVSDDNSYNDLRSIVNKYINLKSKDITFKYYKNSENLSFYWNSCAAYSRCTGEFGMFLHHDDYFTDNNCLAHCIEVLDKNKDVHIVITNSIVEHYLKTMMSWNYHGWQIINGQKYIAEYLYTIAHPSYSSVLFDRGYLQHLGYESKFILRGDYKSKKIQLDEAFVFIILLCLNSDVAINGKVYTFRGSPPDSYSRSNQWASLGGSIGGLIPLLNLYFKETNENKQKMILSVILKVYTNLHPKDLRFLPFLIKKYGNSRFLVQLFMMAIINRYMAILLNIFSLKMVKYLLKKLFLR
ncbi:glycosyltransferase family 2 protein [Synechococcus sp. MIT S9508]|uniref:glycosyltransferase family 2 protein n=1 Tax=Synechococcus sp. MIT S9508 TaxID=1801629 RepID=UPI0007BBF3FC|nr:glycosyltransferase family 2 protein [Synechococcus sp. MIT S9508]KZR90581.1 GalNAc(5)-diNAcBac-PP-undecaprenol beta-1,3-glucosyltransferase [Synechococcus sp. MIT S9508]